eukprot:UN24311
MTVLANKNTYTFAHFRTISTRCKKCFDDEKHHKKFSNELFCGK